MPIIIIDGYISDGFNAASSTPQRRSVPAPVPHDPFWVTAEDKPRGFDSVKTDITRQSKREEDAKKPKVDYSSYRGGSYIII